MKQTSFLVVLPILTLTSIAFAGDAVDTRVTFTVADDDILKGPEESITGSPTIPNFLPSPDNRLFFDDYERRDTGFENLTHFVLYAHSPGFFEGLDTEAGLVLRAEVLDESAVALSDDGSYIKLTRDLDKTTKLALTAFPISADRFRLGYSYDLSWGGSRIFKTSTAAPGLRLTLDGPLGYAFAGVKTGLSQVIMPDGTIESDTVWGVLAGGGIDIVDELRMEAGGGFFDRGVIDKEELKIPENGEFDTAPWQGFGGSAQIVYHVGLPIGVPIDFRLYKNDPLLAQDVFFEPETYNDKLSFSVAGEASVLGQTLQDPERPRSTTVQWGTAADLSARVKVGKTRLHALAVYRDLAFILFNVPSLAPYMDFPDGIDTYPEFFFSAGADYYIEEWHLTPGVVLGVQRPANVTTVVPAGNNPSQADQLQTLVIRSTNDFQPMEPGDEVELIYAAKGTANWGLSNIVRLVGEIQLSYDPNRRRLADDPTGIPVYLESDPWIIGFNMMLQARF